MSSCPQSEPPALFFFFCRVCWLKRSLAEDLDITWFVCFYIALIGSLPGSALPFVVLSSHSRGQIMTLCDVAVWQNYDAPPSPCQFLAAECPSGTSERCVWMARLCERWGHSSLSAYIYKSLALPHLLLRNIIRMRDAQWCVAHCLSIPRVENTRRFDNALLLPEASTEKSEKHCDLCCKYIPVNPK